MKGAGCKYLTFVMGPKTYSKWFPRIKHNDEWAYISSNDTPTKLVECETRVEALKVARDVLKEIHAKEGK